MKVADIALLNAQLIRIFPNWTRFTPEQVHKAGQWFALSFDTIRMIVADIMADDGYFLRIVYTCISDEFFIDNYLRKVAVSQRDRYDSRFLAWDQPRMAITKHQLDDLLRSSYLFARKFYDDTDLWEQFLDELKQVERDGTLPEAFRDHSGSGGAD
jgi:hypothetical protein